MLDARAGVAGSRRLDAGLAGRRRPRSGPTTPAPLPTADHPALALVLVPRRADVETGGERYRRRAGCGRTRRRPGSSRSTGPLPPGEGDNQALAVNTEDGSVAYDVSFALVWADGDDRAQPQRGLRARQLHATAARSPSPSRSSSSSGRSTSSCRRTSPSRSTTPASSASPTRWPPSSSSACPGRSATRGTTQLAAIWAELQALRRAASRTCRWPSCATGSPSSSSGSSTSSAPDAAGPRPTSRRAADGPPAPRRRRPDADADAVDRRSAGHADGGAARRRQPSRRRRGRPTADARRRRPPRRTTPSAGGSAAEPAATATTPPADPTPSGSAAAAGE